MKKSRVFWLIAALSLGANACKSTAQQPSSDSGLSAEKSVRLWVKRPQIAANEDFILEGLHKANDGGIILSGKISSELGEPSEEQIVVLALDKDGKETWRVAAPAQKDVRTLQVIQSVQAESGGPVYLAYRKGSFQNPDQDEYFVLRVEPTGVLQWHKNLKDLSGENLQAQSLAISPQGQLHLLGTLFASAAEVGECAVAQIDGDGRLVWSRVLKQAASCRIPDFKQTMSWDLSGSLYLALGNQVAKLGAEGQVLWLVKVSVESLQWSQDKLWTTSPEQTALFDSSGKRLWSVSNKGGLRLGVDRLGAALVTVDYTNPSAVPRLKLARIDPTGALLWEHIYTGSESSSLIDFKLSRSGVIHVLSPLQVKRGGLFGGYRTVMGLLSMDTAGRELLLLSSKDSWTAWRLLVVEEEAEVFLGDINGFVEKYRLDSKF